jgi:hypothetical protein
VADVEAFEDCDSRVLSESRRELTVTDVYRPHSFGPVLEEAVGESAGGSTRVEADPLAYPHREFRQCCGEFLPTARDKALRFCHQQVVTRCDQPGSLFRHRPCHQHAPRVDQLLSFVTARCELSFDQLLIEPASSAQLADPLEKSLSPELDFLASVFLGPLAAAFGLGLVESFFFSDFSVFGFAVLGFDF